MTKVYLVTMNECDENGVASLSGKTIVDEVFTNKKQAIAYVNEMNENYWRYERVWYWWYEEKNICKLDFRKKK